MRSVVLFGLLAFILTADRHVKLYMEVDQKHIYKFLIKNVFCVKNY
jgi:hypothetical protein